MAAGSAMKTASQQASSSEAARRMHERSRIDNQLRKMIERRKGGAALRWHTRRNRYPKKRKGRRIWAHLYNPTLAKLVSRRERAQSVRSVPHLNGGCLGFLHAVGDRVRTLAEEFDPLFLERGIVLRRLDEVHEALDRRVEPPL